MVDIMIHPYTVQTCLNISVFITVNVTQRFIKILHTVRVQRQQILVVWGGCEFCAGKFCGCGAGAGTDLRVQCGCGQHVKNLTGAGRLWAIYKYCGCGTGTGQS